MRNEKTQMRQMRDREFLKVYHQVAHDMLCTRRPFVRREAVRRAISEGRPLYYLSFSRAYTVMLHYFAHGDVPVKATEQRAMWLELAAAVKDEQMRHPQLSLPQALARTLATARASRFFISEIYAYKLLYRIVKEHKQSTALTNNN